MTIILLQPDGVAITAQQERQGSAALFGGGSGRQLGGRSGFRVGTPSNVLTVTTTAWTLTPCAAMIDPGAATHQGMYGWATDANITGAPTPPDATLPRKDLYYIQINDSTSGDGSGEVTAQVKYLAGTPASSPAAPSLPARSFEIATVTVPQVGGGNPTVVLNPARFAAAGAILPVSSTTERDALTKYNGLMVVRLDLAGRPTETWDGSAWQRTLASLNAGAATDMTSTYAGWSIPFATGNRRPRVWSPDGVTVHMSGLVQFTTGTASIIQVPAAFAPADSAVMTYVGSSVTSYGSGQTNPGQVLALGIEGGALEIVYQGGSIQSGSYVPLVGTWRITG